NKKNKNLELPLVINNVTMLDDENYITDIDMTFLVKMLQSQLILYDYESQRSAVYVRTKDKVVPTPDINIESVNTISQLMLNETYMPDMITLNAYSPEVDAVIYDQQARTLTINDGAVITILDGFHRLRGGEKAVMINPDLPQRMFLSIRNYDKEGQRNYFGQINTINVVKKERLEELKSERQADFVVRDLQRKSDLKGKIASASNISKIANQLTTFSVLAYAIDQVFKPETKLEANEVSKYLIDFFNYLLGSYVEEFLINPNEFRHSYSHPLMFAGYVQIAKNMRDNEIPLKQIKNYIDGIDFENQELQSILSNNRGINFDKNRRNIISYFIFY
ncbi:DNA sulfur modification protein DndB, partial [Paenibacillus sp. Marseille-Q4541]|uniref:DNA sulfur modification protein DndB n=1 Tax=Paenibacillus sp. Marseille-Q4541 TaxID=2831522 RepID=UPI001BA67FEB